MFRSLSYFTILSGLVGAPAFKPKQPKANAKSAIKSSIVSPLLWLTISSTPLSLASFMVRSVSESVPIWFGFMIMQLILVMSMALRRIAALVTVRSSPTTSNASRPSRPGCFVRCPLRARCSRRCGPILPGGAHWRTRSSPPVTRLASSAASTTSAASAS